MSIETGFVILLVALVLSIVVLFVACKRMSDLSKENDRLKKLLMQADVSFCPIDKDYSEYED